MSPLVSTIHQALAILTIVGQVGAVFLIVLLFFGRKRWSSVFNFTANNSFIFAFTIALIATTASLFYSEIAGFTPCILCWYQRILMYSQVFLFGTALWKNEYITADYHIVLSVVGVFITGYHYLLQIGVMPELPCSAVGFSVSCAERFVMQFGYITIPLMAFTAFVMITLLMFINKRRAY
jgi:disulfide bond formation protein DsbB